MGNDKLKLEEIVGYFPHKLQMLYTHTNKVGFVRNVFTLGDGYDDDDLKLSIDHGDGEHLWMFKPLLYPLSSLTEFREDLGFVPLEELLRIAYNPWYLENINKRCSEIETINTGRYFNSYFVFMATKEISIDSLGIKNTSLWIIEFFQQWHIDYKNLICRNLAIDKTKI